MDVDQQSGSIASHVTKAILFFRNLQDVLSRPATPTGDFEGATLNDFPLHMENHFARFKMWVGNQAALQSRPFSLDDRLRTAFHLRRQVIYLVKDICDSLQTAISLIRNSPSSLKQDRKVQVLQDDNSHSSPPDSGESDESDFSDTEPDGQPGSGLTILLTDIGEAIDCLLRLSVAIANPALHDRSRKLGTEPSKSLSLYEPYEPKDIAHVRNQFPSIANELAVALGSFITRRRQSIKNGQAYLGKYWYPDADRYDTTLVQKYPLSDAKTSQTTSTHHRLFASTDQTTSILGVPPLPSTTGHGMFKCPFCHRLTFAANQAAWERHVFEDLRPYRCIDPSCIGSNSEFDSRSDWQSHVYKYHWQSWSCPFECQQPFSAAAELSGHIRAHHFPTGTEEELKSISALGERVRPDDVPSACSLCGHSIKGLVEYIDHVGFHLEQLALFALPSLERKAGDPSDFDRNLEELDLLNHPGVFGKSGYNSRAS